jgi:hypothetical protein
LDLKEGAVVANRFRLVSLLGKGGMGSVWLAQHIGLDIPCAVKFIHAESAANLDARARFEREARAAAQLRTPNVVQILDYGVFEETPYIAMELLVGEPLSARLSRCARLDPHETLRIVAQIGRALGKAHQAGIVHRDLKPENVYLVADEEGEIAKVLDFGVAKQTIGLTDSNTRTGALLGTPYYMSPEQAQGIKAVDARADLWSLAVLCYRCTTGELPFRSEALGDLLIKIVMQPLPVPSHVARDVPPGFDAWWERAAQRDPDRRFQTAKELVDALAAGLGVSLGGAALPGTVTGAPGFQERPGLGAGAVAAQTPQGSWDASQAALALGTQSPSTTPWQRQATPFPAGDTVLGASGPAPHGAGYASAGFALAGGQRPLPGSGAGPGSPQGAQVASPATMASGPRGYPDAASAARPASPYPPTAQLPAVTAPMPAQPAATGAQPQPAPAGGFALLPQGESGSGPSVAGVATQTPRPAGRGRGALIGPIVAAALVFGTASTFLVYRGRAGRAPRLRGGSAFGQPPERRGGAVGDRRSGGCGHRHGRCGRQQR